MGLELAQVIDSKTSYSPCAKLFLCVLEPDDDDDDDEHRASLHPPLCWEQLLAHQWWWGGCWEVPSISSYQAGKGGSVPSLQWPLCLYQLLFVVTFLVWGDFS